MYLRSLIDRNFVEYASYVIRDRAIPNVDDGMKPVQRRILHALWELDDGKFNKVANVIGHAMKYHPHGDASIGEALVNLANRDYFIDRQGNFGNLLTGDAASAPRYIECRLTPFAREVLFNPDITETVPSYDGRNREPVTLPAKVPVLLMLGAEGIAVGLSTRILPHNFDELLEAQILWLRGKRKDLVPDFPQGGLVDPAEYDDGRGRVRVRARIERVSNKSLVIRELPYGSTTESLIASIEDAARKGRIKISRINDYTAEQVEIEVVAGRGVSARDLEDGLYAFTDCEVALKSNIVVIHEGRPRQMSVSEILALNTGKLRADLEKELRIDLGRQQDAEFRKTLVQVFIEKRVYKAIEEKKTADAVRRAVLEGLAPHRKLFKRDVTDEDVQMLLEIPIRRISRFDIEKNQRELAEIRRRIRAIRRDLKDMTAYTIGFLEALRKKYGRLHPRRTRIARFDSVDLREADMSVLKLRYDEKTGYLGTDVRTGRLLSATPYDRILVIRRDGSYRVIAPPKKAFVGERAPHLDLHDPKTVFNLVYRDRTSGLSYAKRFRVEKYVTDREYRYFPDPGTLQFFAAGPEFRVRVHYRRKPRLKVLEEDFDFSGLAVRSPAARGNRVAAKEVSRVRRLRGGEARPPARGETLKLDFGDGG